MDIGIDPIHFGVLMVLTLTVGGATPPVGIMLYIVADIAQISFQKLVKEMLPLYIPLASAILLTAYIPKLSLIILEMFFYFYNLFLKRKNLLLNKMNLIS